MTTEQPTERPQCLHCGKPAVIAAQAGPLCIDCFYKFQVAGTLAFRMNAISMNHALDQMEAVTGIYGLNKKMQVPDIPRGPPILNNIKIDNSVVGAVNTGSVSSIDVSITHLKVGGNDKASAALTDLTEAIARAPGVSDADRNQMLDQVAFLSEQATQAAGDRRPGMIKAAFDAVAGGASAISSVSSAWAVAEPLLRSVFGS